jgi:3-isopropylmalate/(R)-2-methylmalate dehydratase large subunit
MSQTMAEKILSRTSGAVVGAGDLAVAAVDFALGGVDSSTPLTAQVFRETGATRLFDPGRVAFAVDHATPAPNDAIAGMQQVTRRFAREMGAILIEEGEGICHQVLLERGYVRPGMLIPGADSHSCTYGGLNALGTGIGSTDMAAVLATGKMWVRVPESIRVMLHGTLRPGATAKDLVLRIVGDVGADGANYQAVEFAGDGLAGLSIGERCTIANMAIEMGAKTGIFEADAATHAWLHERSAAAYEPVAADPDAHYTFRREYDLGRISPFVARPGRVDDVVPIEAVAGTRVTRAFIGTCTNGRLEDLRDAARALQGRRVHPDVRLLLIPASRQVLLDAMAEGVLQTFLDAGAILAPPGCGPCPGIGVGVPSDGDVVIASMNRNFKGRMGNPKAEIYLASPIAVAAAAVAGHIVDPREVLAGAAE